MAYGKNATDLPETGSFRQSAHHHQATKPKFGGRGGSRFSDAYKPGLDVPDTIRLVRGMYEVPVATNTGQVEMRRLFYFPYVDHYHGILKKGAICSAGPAHAFKNLREPCHGCDMFWQGKESGRKSRGPMSKRDMYGFTVLHYAPYAKMEQVDRETGQIRTNNEGKPFYEWVRVLPHERQKYQGREMRDAHVLHWSLGFGHWNVLVDYDKHIGASCRNCGGVDCIQSEAWGCKSCGELIIDVSSTHLSPKQIDDITMAPVKCPKCGTEAFLQEYINCTKCGNGARADLFDVDLTVKRIAASDGSNQNVLSIVKWSEPRPIDQRFIEIAKPLDLPKIFSPDSLERQAQIWQITAAPVPQEPQYRQYTPQAPQQQPMQQAWSAPQQPMQQMPVQQPVQQQWVQQPMPQPMPQPQPQQPQYQPQYGGQPAQPQPPVAPQQQAFPTSPFNPMAFPGFPTGGFPPGGGNNQ